KTRPSVIKSDKIDLAAHPRQEAPGKEEVRVAGDSFIQHAFGLGQLLPRVDQVGGVGKQRLRAQVKVVSREVSRGWLLYRRFFTRSDFGLKLISACLRDFTLD